MIVKVEYNGGEKYKCSACGEIYEHKHDADIHLYRDCQDCPSQGDPGMKFMPLEKGKNYKVRLVTEHDKELTCTDNTGMEEHFDRGVTYLAEGHENIDMLWVYDKLGRRIEVFADRFEGGSHFAASDKGLFLHHRDKMNQFRAAMG